VKIYDQFGQTQNPDGLGDSEPFCLSPSFVPSPTSTVSPTITNIPPPSRTPTKTATPTRTPPWTSTPRPSATPQYTLVNVYFVDNKLYEGHVVNPEMIGKRWVLSNNLPGNVLNEYFKGPGYTEKYTYGWIAVYDGFTGYSKLDVTDGIARVYLTGTCAPVHPWYTIADALKTNLKQFLAVQFVKVYDQNGTTKDPDGRSDSAPICLQP
jgi:hypothetical protein